MIDHDILGRTMRINGRNAMAAIGVILCKTAVAGHYTAVMDLSYKPHLKTTTISDAIVNALQKGEAPSAVELDVSFTELGNEGVVTVLQSIRATRDAPLILDLTARMNRLTPEDVSTMLKNSFLDEKDVTSKSEKSSFVAPMLQLHALDLGWNSLGPGQVGSKEFLSSLRQLMESPANCPRSICLHNCGLGPAACRAIGKGLMKQFESSVASPLTLSLCGNEAIGDAGTAALAAALRRSSKGTRIIMKELGLSKCDVGDSGAEALSLTLDKVQYLDLSNNKISDEGAAALGRALTEETVCESLDLCNNQGVGDSGAAEIAAAMGRGSIKDVSLRSCQVYADGAKAFGMALVGLSKLKGDNLVSVKMDLSGNPLGVLRGKKKSDGGKYSASNLKSKASATTASYMKFIGKQIRSGLGNNAPQSGESDDEAEEGDDDSQQVKQDASKARCGAKAFASAIVHEEQHNQHAVVDDGRKKCELGMRHCFLDRGGADALAASILQAKHQLGVELVIDAGMNSVLDEEMIEALSGNDPDALHEMAERHMSMLETLRIAEERAVEAAAAAAARRREEAEWESDYRELDLDPFAEEEEDGYDSDARYDDEYDQRN